MAVIEHPEMQRVGAFAQQLPQALFALIERAGEAVELASDNGELLLETVLRAACDRKTVLPFGSVTRSV